MDRSEDCFVLGKHRGSKLHRNTGKLLADDNTAQNIPEYSIFIIIARGKFNQNCFLKKYDIRQNSL
jgi:hypothetical protein